MAEAQSDIAKQCKAESLSKARAEVDAFYIDFCTGHVNNYAKANPSVTAEEITSEIAQCVSYNQSHPQDANFLADASERGYDQCVTREVRNSCQARAEADDAERLAYLQTQIDNFDKRIVAHCTQKYANNLEACLTHYRTEYAPDLKLSPEDLGHVSATTFLTCQAIEYDNARSR